MPNIKLKGMVRKVRGGHQAVVTFSDGRDDVKGPIESIEQSNDRLHAACEAVVVAVMRDIAAGHEASISITSERHDALK